MQAKIYRQAVEAGRIYNVAYRAQHIYHVTGPDCIIGVDTPSVHLQAGKGLEDLIRPMALIVEPLQDGIIELLCCVDCKYKDDRLTTSSTVTVQETDYSSCVAGVVTVTAGTTTVVAPADSQRRGLTVYADQGNTAPIYIQGNATSGLPLYAGDNLSLDRLTGVVTAYSDATATVRRLSCY